MLVDDLDVNTVNLAGPVTLYESSEIRETLLAAIGEGKAVRIDLGLAGPWDIAGFQLLISAVATGLKEGIPVRLANVPGVCREIAERAGLADWLAEVTPREFVSKLSDLDEARADSNSDFSSTPPPRDPFRLAQVLTLWGSRTGSGFGPHVRWKTPATCLEVLASDHAKSWTPSQVARPQPLDQAGRAESVAGLVARVRHGTWMLHGKDDRACRR